MPGRASFLIFLLILYSIAPSQGGSALAMEPKFNPSLMKGDTSQVLAKDTSSLDIDDVKNIHREFDHREQVITAAAFMGVMVFLLAGMNNFNPRNQQ